MNASIDNKTPAWIKDTLKAFALIRRRGTPSNIMDVVLEYAPDLQEAIDLEAHWTSVVKESTDQTELAILHSVQTLRAGIAKLWKLAMEEGAFFQIRGACSAQPRTYEILFPHCGRLGWINDLFLFGDSYLQISNSKSLSLLQVHTVTKSVSNILKIRGSLVVAFQFMFPKTTAPLLVTH